MTNDHTGVYLFTGTDKESASLLGIVQTVGNSFSGFKGDQGALLAVLDVALIGAIAVKNGIHDPISLGIRHKFAAIADQSSGRNGKLETGIAAVCGSHITQLALALAQLFNYIS